METIVLTPGTQASIAPGAGVLVQVTCEARRGPDTYSIPHAAVTLSVTGAGASVSPTAGDSGDTGAFQVMVTTGNRAGEDTVLTATAGSATAQLTLHTSATAAGAGGAAAAGPSAAASADDDHTTRAVLIAIAAAVLLSAAGVLGVRSNVWSRRRSPRGHRSV